MRDGGRQSEEEMCEGEKKRQLRRGLAEEGSQLECKYTSARGRKEDHSLTQRRRKIDAGREAKLRNAQKRMGRRG